MHVNTMSVFNTTPHTHGRHQSLQSNSDLPPPILDGRDSRIPKCPLQHPQQLSESKVSATAHIQVQNATRLASPHRIIAQLPAHRHLGR